MLCELDTVPDSPQKVAVEVSLLHGSEFQREARLEAGIEQDV